MELSPEQRQAVRNAIEAVHRLNNTLETLHRLDIAAGIRRDLHDKAWLLDIKALIRREHYT